MQYCTVQYILESHLMINTIDFDQPDIDGLVQERCNSCALAMELGLSCINPSICASVKI